MSDWLVRLTEARAEGFVLLDLLTAIDRDEELEVVARLVNRSGTGRILSTRIPAAAAELDSATSVFPAADWHERETAEMFGIVFTGHPDPRPLLLRSSVERPPLRRSTALPVRVATPWPGSAPATSERSGSRRRQLPPGVRGAWLEEDA